MIAWQPVRTAPVVLAGSAFAAADHPTVPVGDHLDPLVMIIGGLVLLSSLSASGDLSADSD